MKYHIKNKLSKKALKEQRKKPLPLMNTSVCIKCYKIGTMEEIRNHKCLGKMGQLIASKIS